MRKRSRRSRRHGMALRGLRGTRLGRLSRFDRDEYPLGASIFENQKPGRIAGIHWFWWLVIASSLAGAVSHVIRGPMQFNPQTGTWERIKRNGAVV